MDRWDVLFDQTSAAVALEQQWIEWQRAMRSDRNALSRWSADAASEVLHAVRSSAADRAEVLAQRTSVSLLVLGPDWSTVAGALVGVVRVVGPEREPTAPSEHKPTVALGGDEIQVYAHVVPGHLPTVNLLVPGDVTAPRRAHLQRWVTLPAARIGWGHDGRVLLVGAAPDQAPLRVDDLVFRAFELLLRRIIQRATPRGPRTLDPIDGEARLEPLARPPKRPSPTH